MHYAFDHWITKHRPENPWARYADDGIVHCRTKTEAEQLLKAMEKRMQACKLELHPEKTKIVYCRSDRFNGKHENEEFNFLGYTFCRRYIRNSKGGFFNGFTPAVSKAAGQELRDKIREIRLHNKACSIEGLAELINPVVRGWYNYFSRYSTSIAKGILTYLNISIARWIKGKYKSIKESTYKAMKLLIRISLSTPKLFYHWQIGLLPTIG